MNENELTTLLERAADRLAPDVGALVEGGTRRGRRRRRARTGAVLGTAAVLAVAGLAWQAGGGGAADRTGRDPLAATASPGSPAASSAGSDGQRALPADGVLVQRLLDHLPDGEVTDVSTEPVPEAADALYQRGLVIGLRLDGADVEVRINDVSVDPQRLADARRTTNDDCAQTPCPAKLAKRATYSPRSSCELSECRELPDGSWLWSRSGDGRDGSDASGFRGNWAGIFTLDGWGVQVSAFNARDVEGGGYDHGTVVTDAPVLSLDQVTELATAGFWFE